MNKNATRQQDTTKAYDALAKILMPRGSSSLESSSAAVKESVWDQIPPRFEEFLTSKEYLGQHKLSRRQQAAMDAILGDDPTKIFTNMDLPHEAALVWGKGSGKDLLVSYLMAYISYVICCMKDPHNFFGMADDEALDIVNIAPNARQANQVFFTKLTSRIKRPCFNRFNPKIGKETIEFPFINLRLHSKHSENEGWEGFNVIAWVMDEASAFRTRSGTDNAKRCYDTLHSSADTRFISYRWIGMMISFPRKQVNDFTYDKWVESATNPKIYGDRGATWDINPQWDETHPLYKDIPWEVIEDLNLRVPAPYAQHFKKDPIDARTKYMADPPPQEDGFFEIPAKLSEAVNKDLMLPVVSKSVIKRAILKTSASDETLETSYVHIDIERLPLVVNDAEYFMHGDPGLVKDYFSLCVCHTLPQTIIVADEEGERELKKVVVDFVLTWEPKSNIPVDVLNVDEVILKIARYYGIKKVTFDKWNSANSIQKLWQNNIAAYDMSFSNAQQLQMYRNLKLLVYSNFIDLPDDEELFNELLFLKYKNGRIDHDAYGKDRADAVAAAVWEATGIKKGRVAKMVQETMEQYENYKGYRSVAIKSNLLL